jgi:large exoprotein involved in heme utilization and adhesion
VNADSIMLDRQGGISADTQSGRGGNVILNADNLIWRGGSFTTATSRGTGNGGNITFNTNNLVALEGSRVTANAFKGIGGNIKVNTQGLFICESCQVTASSELGLDGVVDIETLEPTTLNSLDIPQQLTQPQEEVAVACPSEPRNNNSQLTITGRGGLPNRPQELLNARSLIEFAPVAASKTPIKQATLPSPARGWYRLPSGQVMLTAQNIVNSASPHNSPINSVNCHN